MKRTTPLLKIVALVFSITLAGGYVGYRALGARAAETPPAQPSPPAKSGEVPKALLGGSKSEAVIFISEDPKSDSPYLGSSKSLAPFIRFEDIEKAKKKDAPQQEAGK